MEYFRVIQHASTIFGAVVLLIWFRHWFRKTAPTQPDRAQEPRKNRRKALLGVSIIAMAAAVLRGLFVLGFRVPWQVDREKVAFECAVITSIGVFWLGVVAYGAFRTHRELRSS
jgi:uncharacterized membrane protein YfcA